LYDSSVIAQVMWKYPKDYYQAEIFARFGGSS